MSNYNTSANSEASNQASLDALISQINQSDNQHNFQPSPSPIEHQPESVEDALMNDLERIVANVSLSGLNEVDRLVPTHSAASALSSTTVHSVTQTADFTVSSTTTTTVSSTSVASSADSQYQSANLSHSGETIEIIKKIEAEGMDYIDYDLIIETINYIVTKFNEEGQKHGHQQHHNKKKKLHKPAKPHSGDEITTENGSILVFVPGWEDITRLMDLAAAHPVLSHAAKYLLLPLHSGISPAQQRAIFHKPPKVN